MNVPHRAAAGRLPHETLDALLQRLAGSRDGLLSEDARRRLRSGGPNEFKTTQLRSEMVELIRGSANPLVIILLITYEIIAAFAK